MLEKLNEAKTKDGNYNQIMKETFQSVMQEYEELGLKYDKETNHSMNKEKQEEWNLFIEAELQKIELKRFEDK
jgi:hypothetical protein